MPLHIEETGPAEAPSLVLLHGGGVGGWMWRRQVAEFSRDYHCLVPDLPGHGQSPADGPFSIFAAARQVAELIHRQAHGGKAHVVGASLGGQVAVALLGMAPKQVDHALIASALLRPLPLAGFMRLALRLYGPFKDRDFFIRANMRGLGVPAEYYPEFAADTRRATPQALAGIFVANLSFKLPPGLSRLANPTLVTVGEREPAVMRRSGRDLVQAMPGATGRLVESQGHNWPLSAPDFFNRVLRAWITDQELPNGLTILRSRKT